MIKNFKFMGIALLVAGLSFAVSSCQKENPVQSSDDAVAEQTVDFSELTKADDGQVESSLGGVQNAVKDLCDAIQRYYDAKDKGYKGIVSTLDKYLFASFTQYFAHDTTVVIKDTAMVGFRKMLALVSQVSVAVDSGYIHKSFKDNKLSLITDNGYFLSVKFSDFIDMGYEIEKLPVLVGTFNDDLIISIGKDKQTYAETYVDFGWVDGPKTQPNLFLLGKHEKEYGTVIASLRNSASWNDTLAQVSYKFDRVSGIIDSDSIDMWYDNGVATSIEVVNVPEVLAALSKMTYSYKYTGDEADKIIEDFNGNVYNHSEDTLAFVSGYTLRADRQENNGVYRVNLWYGTDPQKLVKPEDAYKYLSEKFKKLISSYK